MTETPKMSPAKAEALMRLIKHENKQTGPIVEQRLIESPDGTPAGISHEEAPGAHMGRVQLTEQQWAELAHYAAEKLSGPVSTTAYTNWEEAARALINETTKEQS
ncbi:hypothetical protein LSI54_09105 [Nesterenkonia sp. AY15]|uniref:hypothetical protein n=1 Tax=Nesterenkonia sp. AY15 TaxID=2901139 RepID=UPI001F4C697D|nr:hypothetical protein [Nesterenkonia sp. AY15]MCH8571508.1 hypothetical protein [Nesterenkonia sp. AY15]